MTQDRTRERKVLVHASCVPQAEMPCFDFCNPIAARLRTLNAGLFRGRIAPRDALNARPILELSLRAKRGICFCLLPKDIEGTADPSRAELCPNKRKNG